MELLIGLSIFAGVMISGRWVYDHVSTYRELRKRYLHSDIYVPNYQELTKKRLIRLDF